MPLGRTLLLRVAIFAIVPIAALADPIPFPTGVVPFESLAYETLPNASGFSLVVGQAPVTLLSTLEQIAVPAGTLEYFAGTIELAPGVHFDHVLIPTIPELLGDFREFDGPIYDPLNFSTTGPATQFAVNYGIPSGNYAVFAKNIIPLSSMYGIFAFQLGPDPSVATPEPGAAWLILAGGAALALRGARVYARRR